MTRDDIIRMAQHSGWEMPFTWDETDGFLQRIERFAALVAAAEREACAKVCDAMATPATSREAQLDFHWAAGCCAAAIRARD